ncbi:hypothetical protein D0S45_12225 [Marinifilum sp. JC120]|nr:hypothetical protein D0S45_12225 [Marinifilum sp. JC120]
MSEFERVVPKLSSVSDPKQRSLSLRIMHAVCCTGRQKIKVVDDRLEYSGLSSNKLVNYYSAIEGISRFILLKRLLYEIGSNCVVEITKDLIEDKYRGCKSIPHNELIKEVSCIYPKYFDEDNVQSAWSEYDKFKEVRNYLVHECGMINSRDANMLIATAEIILDVLKQIVKSEKGMNKLYFEVEKKT